MSLARWMLPRSWNISVILLSLLFTDQVDNKKAAILGRTGNSPTWKIPDLSVPSITGLSRDVAELHRRSLTGHALPLRSWVCCRLGFPEWGDRSKEGRTFQLLWLLTPFLFLSFFEITLLFSPYIWIDPHWKPKSTHDTNVYCRKGNTTA